MAGREAGEWRVVAAVHFGSEVDRCVNWCGRGGQRAVAEGEGACHVCCVWYMMQAICREVRLVAFARHCSKTNASLMMGAGASRTECAAVLRHDVTVRAMTWRFFCVI